MMLYNKYIPPQITIQSAVMSTFGIGQGKALKILDTLCINPKRRFFELTQTQISRLSRHISVNFAGQIDSALRREINEKIKHMFEIRSYKGSRHKKGLPVRGQRTHTNARTRKKLFHGGFGR